MKRKSLFLLALLLISFIFGFILNNTSNQNSVTSPSPAPDDAFILGAMSNNEDNSYTYISDPNAFEMNLWHRYTGSQLLNGKYYLWAGLRKIKYLPILVFTSRV